MKMLFSVIIPVFNVKEYVDQCVESVISQKHEGYEYEIILVDDGSTDGSGLLCDKYSNKNNVKVIHKTNGGLGSARNVGLENAVGEYVWFVDSDDFVEADSLNKLYSIIMQYRYDMILFGAQCFTDERDPLLPDYYRRTVLLNKRVNGKTYLFEALLNGEYYTSVCLRLFRREYIANRRFDENILHEDEDFGFFTSLEADAICVLTDRLYHRRYRNGSIMSNNNLCKRIEGYYYAWKKITEYASLSEIDKDEKDLCIIRSKELVYIILTIYCNLCKGERKSNKKKIEVFLKNISGFSEYYGRGIKIAIYNVELYYLCKTIANFYRNIRDKIRVIKIWPGAVLSLLKLKKAQKILLFGTPFHGNYGDHLIAEAEMVFLRKYFDKTIVECPMEFVNFFWKSIKRNITASDILVVSGGGWLGTEWRHDEIFVRKIISTYPENRIIVFPQTVFYEGDNEFLLSGAKLYSEHKELYVCVREKQSYTFLVNSHFLDKSRVILMPDFALLSERHLAKADMTKRFFYGYCFREDREKILSDEKKNALIAELKKMGNTKKILTNDEGSIISPLKRRKKLDSKFNEFASLKMIITDRLHAVIFSYLSGTTCFFFDNKTNKLSGVYEWVKKCGYIYEIEDDMNYSDCVNSINTINNCIDNNYWCSIVRKLFD